MWHSTSTALVLPSAPSWRRFSRLLLLSYSKVHTREKKICYLSTKSGKMFNISMCVCIVRRPITAGRSMICTLGILVEYFYYEYDLPQLNFLVRSRRKCDCDKISGFCLLVPLPIPQELYSAS